MTRRSPFARAAALALALCAAGCGDGRKALPDPVTAHLLDLPGQVVGDATPELAALEQALAGDTVWVLTERLSDRSWTAVGADSGQPLWRAQTHYDVRAARLGSAEAIRRPSPAAEAAPEDPSADLAPGQVRVCERGVEVALTDPDQRPEVHAVSYLAGAAEVRAELASSDAEGHPVAAETELAPRTRRAVTLPGGRGLEWSLELPPEARLHFSYALARWAMRLHERGVQLVPPTAMLHLAVEVSAGGESERVWEESTRPTSGELDRWNDAEVDLSRFAGRRVTVRFSCQAEGGAPGVVSRVLWGEPVVCSAAPQSVPDIVVILLDTLRADRLGCYGCERARTPVIDALAARGVRYDQVMSSAPWTLPSHASLFTSSYVSQHGLWTEKRLADEEVTLAEVLRARGYRTAAFTEGGYVRPLYGLAQGFDLFEAKKREGEETFASAREWIEAASGPFFAFVQTYQTHSPYDPPDDLRAELVRPYDGPMKRVVHVPDYDWAHGTENATPPSSADARYIEDLYDGEVAYADRLVGEFLDGLGAGQSGRDLLVVLTSDHGDEFFDHGQAGHGWSLYEEQLRIPLILWLPGTFDGGEVVRAPVHQVDIAPTIARLARAPVPSAWVGAPLGFGPAASDRPLFAPYRTRFHRNRGVLGAALREGAMKYVDYPAGQRPLDPIQGPALFDLAADPGETENLLRPEEAPRWRARVKELLERYPDRGQAHSLDAASPDRDELRALGYVGDQEEEPADSAGGG